MTKRRQGQNRRSTKNKLKFDHRLVLTNWMLELFGVAIFEAIDLRRDTL